MKVKIDLSKMKTTMSPHFHFLLEDKWRYVVLRGGRGSGKSYSVARAIILKILRDFDLKQPHLNLTLRSTLSSAKKSVIPLFKSTIEAFGINRLVKFNKAESIFTFINGSQIIISGLDQSAKIKSMEGLTSVWYEEADAFDSGSHADIDFCLRGKTIIPYINYFSFNPCAKNWLWDEFFTKDSPEVYLDHSTYKHNTFLQDDKYEKKLQALKKSNRNLWEVFCNGKWGAVGNIIYQNWDIQKFPDRVDETVYGSDFGFTNPSTLIQVSMYDGEVYLRELIYESGLTNLDLINRVKHLKLDGPIYMDSAEPARIKEFQNFGLNAQKAKKGPKSVKDGIDFCKRYKIHIEPESANLIKEIENYSWKLDKNDEPTEDPTPFQDHALDGFRYGFYTHFGPRVAPDIFFI